jgi:hypothetical protein
VTLQPTCPTGNKSTPPREVTRSPCAKTRSTNLVVANHPQTRAHRRTDMTIQTCRRTACSATVLATLGAALIVAAAPALAATIQFDKAIVLVSSNARVIVSVIYSCDASSGVAGLRVEMEDHDTDSTGTGRALPTCDSTSHLAAIRVDAANPDGQFQARDEALVTVRLVDASGNVVGTAADSTMVTLELAG